MATTPNIGIPIDTPQVTTGPAWATDIETFKTLVDAHTHVSGAGAQVPTAGLNINAALPMGGYGLTNAGTLGLASQATTSSGTANLFYNSGGNVYWNNASGVPVQITSGNALNVASLGGITGLSGTTAALTYSDALKTFIATADTLKAAALDHGALTIRETNVTNAKGITFASPVSLGADYTLTLPANIPPVSGVMLVDTTGKVGIGKVSVSGLLPANQFYVYSTFSKTGIAQQSFATMFGNNVVKDTASAYNSAQGIYTIPADGDYQFGWNVPGQVTTGSGGFLQSAIVINSGVGGISSGYGASAKIYAGGAQGDGGRSFGLPGTFMYMNGKVGDRVKVGLWWDEAGSHTAGQTASMTLASGYNYFYGYQVR